MRLPLILLSASASLGCFSYPAQAAAPADQVAKLGQSLTQLGAEKAANADGSIPEYTGGNTTLPAGFSARGSKRRTERERESDDSIGIDAHQLGCVEIK